MYRSEIYHDINKRYPVYLLTFPYLSILILYHSIENTILMIEINKIL